MMASEGQGLEVRTLLVGHTIVKEYASTCLSRPSRGQVRCARCT